jgi:hypothetical protein
VEVRNGRKCRYGGHATLVSLQPAPKYEAFGDIGTTLRETIEFLHSSPRKAVPVSTDAS